LTKLNFNPNNAVALEKSSKSLEIAKPPSEPRWKVVARSEGEAIS